MIYIYEEVKVFDLSCNNYLAYLLEYFNFKLTLI